MLRHELIEVLTTKPFKPFRIFVSDGATYVIRHPDLLWVSPSLAYVGVSEGDQPGPAVDRLRIVDLGHITRLEEVEAARKSSNGDK